eukprot:TRINITY_DN78244_c0_g1_i1.p1 TRINITY_DN78244_c0_g1~~TRINITY_DN78244_c0_g1_i1.p1  ORF type:complete len:317 (-),score=47.18 TRINITY_DN78244_c0_g1_i1:176-1126(-)
MLALTSKKRLRQSGMSGGLKATAKRSAGTAFAADQRQSRLAVARCCRHCGRQLTALEDAVHSCTLGLEWPFAAEAVSSASLKGSTTCRIVRLGSSSFRGAAGSHLVELWEHIRENDLSHTLELPSAERIASGVAWLLLGLRGKEVVAMMSAERLGPSAGLHFAADCSTPPPLAIREDGRPSKQPGRCTDSAKEGVGMSKTLQQHTRAESTARDRGEVRTPSPRRRHASGCQETTLGVALIWVRRAERRRGIATALINAARHLAGSAGGSRDMTVAFSEPTDLGFAFASAYTSSKEAARSSSMPSTKLVVYQPATSM